MDSMWNALAGIILFVAITAFVLIIGAFVYLEWEDFKKEKKP